MSTEREREEEARTGVSEKEKVCARVCERTMAIWNGGASPNLRLQYRGAHPENGFASSPPMMDGSLMAPRKRSSFGLQQISEFFNRHQHRAAIKTISPRQENRL